MFTLCFTHSFLYVQWNRALITKKHCFLNFVKLQNFNGGIETIQEGYARSYIYKHTMVMESQSNSLVLFKLYQDRASSTALAVLELTLWLRLISNSYIHEPLSPKDFE